MRSTQLEAMLEESGLDAEAGDDLRAALAPLQQPDTCSPAPSDALAALFPATETGTPVAEVPPAPVTPLRTRGRRAVSGALVLALAGVGATGLSAAANTLPAPWQQHVSEFSHRYLPFDLPGPRPAPPRTRPPLSGAPQPRAAAKRLSPAPKQRHVPRADAAVTAQVPQRATKDAAQVRPAATPRVAPTTTTRPATRHSSWAGPSPAAAPTAAPTSQPRSDGQKSTGTHAPPPDPAAAETSSPMAAAYAAPAAAPAKNGQDSKNTGSKNTGSKNTGSKSTGSKDGGSKNGGAQDTGAESANPQDAGKGSGGQDTGPTVTPVKTPAPVTGPIGGLVEGPTTGPVLDVVRGDGGKKGPGEDTSGPGDTVESGPHERAPQADPPTVGAGH